MYHKENCPKSNSGKHKNNTKEIFAPLTKQTVAYKPTVMAKRNLLNQIILEFELKE